MKRIAFLAISAFVGVFALLAQMHPASATPFTDVKRNHWAYDAIQSLAADGIIEGYPNGKFLGQRTMTRYEMAVIIARAVAKVEAENGANRADVDKLRKLMDNYKDQLDGLGVRVSSLEDKYAALDRNTQFAQRFVVHGNLQSAYTQREITQNPVLFNTTTARQGADPVFRFTDAFIRTDATNDPYFGAVGPQVTPARLQWDLTPQYAVTPNLIISMPIRILSYNVGGYRQQQQGIGVNPTLEVSVPEINNLKGLNVRIGELNNMKGSLTGLTFSPPDDFHIVYTDPYRPFPRGIDVTATAFKYLDFQIYGARLDPVGINTGTFAPNTGLTSNNYLGPYYFQQTSNAYSSSPTSDTFTAQGAPLQTVYLTNGVTPGTIFVSFYSGPGCPGGCSFTGPNQGQPGQVGFTYIQTANAVVFNNLLPVGATVRLTYMGYTVAGNTYPLRYMVGGRTVYRIPGVTGASLGLSFNRVFDLASKSPADNTYVQNSAIADTLVSNTVFGLDFVMPIAAQLGAVQTPALFGEFAQSKDTRDFINVPAFTDTASVIGLKFRLLGGDQTLSYQSVGPHFVAGAPFRYSGQAPVLFQFWNQQYLPSPFGIGNDLALNQLVAQTAIAAGNTDSLLTTNTYPFGTFSFPLFNQFKASGPYWYSTYAPNTRGPSGQLNFPLTVGNVDAKLRIAGQELKEIEPNSIGTQIFGAAFNSTVRAKYDSLSAGVTLGVPVFDRKATVSLDSLYERIQRPDTTPFIYADDAAFYGRPGFNALGNAELVGTKQIVYFYPNLMDVKHYSTQVSAAVPITAALTANLQWVEQKYGGEALNTLTQSISETKRALTGGVLYNIPNTNSSVNVFFNKYEFKDDALPNNNWTENRQNIYFSVRF